MFNMEFHERLFSPKQLAEIAGVSPATIKREVARGRLRGVRIGEGRLLRIPASAWAQYLDRVGQQGTRTGDDRRIAPKVPSEATK